MDATKTEAATRRSPPALAMVTKNRSWITASSAVFLFLIAAFIGVRLLNLVIFCLDSDEIFSVSLAQRSWSGLFHEVGYDVVHPPLFYMILKLWIYVGGSGTVWVRLLPALFSFGSLIPFYYLCRSLRLSLWQTNFALALLCLSVDQVFHAQYVRMYSLLFLLSLCSYCAFVKYIESETRKWRPLLVLTIVNVLVVYAHYYGWAVVACQGLCLLLVDRKKVLGFIWSAVAVVVCFIPWLLWAWRFAAMKGGLKPNIGWIPHPKLIDLLGYYAGLTGPLVWPVVSGIFLAVCGVLLYLGSRRLARVRTAVDRWRMPLLLIAALLPPVASFAISQFASESIWGSRHLIVSAVPYYILIALALSYLPIHRFRLVAFFLVAAWGVAGTIYVIHPQLRVNYEVLVKQVAAREPGPERLRLVSPDPYLGFPLLYYLDLHAPGRWTAIRVQSMDELYAIKDRHFWLAYHAERWKGAKHPRQLLTERGYRVGLGIWVSDQWARIVAYPVWQPNE
jgi:uncharacterized membrane protein